uniref:SNF1-related protein kinase regulatory subunit beta-2-like n=1 Tax=Erigeron canadensis TaxID=72917 RepID=UPI001CB915B0|nr:SNF1-related protein kinase regulatory subunit beta-2-like [Erigeron canadensis]
MGNVNGGDEKRKQQEDYYTLQPSTPSQFPLTVTPQASFSPSRNPNQSVQIEKNEFNEISTHYRSAGQEKRIPIVINWIHGGTQVAIEGSWDNWMTRELLDGSGNDFSIVKVLNVGVYYYRFVVDGQWTFAPDLPHERNNMGNEFNILELKDSYPENVDRDQEPKSPSSPVSSYNNALLTLEDFAEKFPELPPLLEQMPLNQRISSKNHQQAIQKPLSANLNHLYIKRDNNNQPIVALSSSQRFRTKFVTTVLYKPFKKGRK